MAIKDTSAFNLIREWLSTSHFTVRQRAALEETLQEASKEFIDDYWTDLRFPASGLNPPGPLQAPETNTDLGTLIFEDTKTQVVAGLAQFPHAWLEGSTIEPHVHWIQPAAGNVVWQLEYRIIQAVNDTLPADWTTVTSTGQVGTYPGSGNFIQISRLPSIDMTGYRISAMVLFKLSRLGGDANDTLAANIDLLEFDIHYQFDAPGSRHEFIK